MLKDKVKKEYIFAESDEQWDVHFLLEMEYILETELEKLRNVYVVYSFP